MAAKMAKLNFHNVLSYKNVVIKKCMKVHYFIKASYTGIPNGETKIVSRSNMAFMRLRNIKIKSTMMYIHDFCSNVTFVCIVFAYYN